MTTFYPEDYFTRVNIDECHRSAWGKWSQVLAQDTGGVHGGLTVMTRELRCEERTGETEVDATPRVITSPI